MALLLAVGILIYFRQPNSVIFDRTCRWTAVVLLVLVAVLVASQILSVFGITDDIIIRFTKKQLSDTALYRTSENWKLILCVLAVSGWALLLLLAAKANEARYKLLYFSFGVMVVFAVAQPVCPAVVLEKKAPGTFLMRFAEKIQPDDILVCYNNTFVPASWYYKRNNIYMYHKGGEMEYGLNKPSAQGRLISVEEFARMVSDPQRKQRIIFTMQAKRFRDGVPQATYEVYEQDHDRIMFMIYPVPGKPAPSVKTSIVE